MDYIAQPALSVTMTKPFNESLNVHVPQIAVPSIEDMLEDMLEDRTKAELATFSHPERVDLTRTSAVDKDLFG